jgi:hypothetical protein
VQGLAVHGDVAVRVAAGDGVAARSDDALHEVAPGRVEPEDLEGLGDDVARRRRLALDKFNCSKG